MKDLKDQILVNVQVIIEKSNRVQTCLLRVKVTDKICDQLEQVVQSLT